MAVPCACTSQAQVRLDWGELEPYLCGPVSPSLSRSLCANRRVHIFARLRTDVPEGVVTLSADVNGTPRAVRLQRADNVRPRPSGEAGSASNMV